MKETTMKRVTGVLVSGIAAGMMLVGCSPSVQGGDTPCKDFVGADEKTQNEAINKMLKDEKGAEPASLEVTGTRLAVSTYCQTAGKQDEPIKNAPHL
jgi:acid stress chaperone HdeA